MDLYSNLFPFEEGGHFGDDSGFLWEHLVLDILPTRRVERGYFIGATKRAAKWTLWCAADVKFRPSNARLIPIALYRILDRLPRLYPQGRNYLVCPGDWDAWLFDLGIPGPIGLLKGRRQNHGLSKKRGIANRSGLSPGSSLTDLGKGY